EGAPTGPGGPAGPQDAEPAARPDDVRRGRKLPTEHRRGVFRPGGPEGSRGVGTYASGSSGPHGRKRPGEATEGVFVPRLGAGAEGRGHSAPDPSLYGGLVAALRLPLQPLRDLLRGGLARVVLDLGKLAVEVYLDRGHAIQA